MVLDVLLLGLLVTSGGPLGTWLGLRYGLSRRVLGRVLAFGAGALMPRSASSWPSSPPESW